MRIPARINGMTHQESEQAAAFEAELRERLAVLVEAAGGQRELATLLGTDQGMLSRFLGGAPLGPSLAGALHRAYPGLRERLAAVVFGRPSARRRDGRTP
jgi:hypothetical protein